MAYVYLVNVFSSAIQPPLRLNITENSIPSTFDMETTSAGITYSINVGAEFGIRCSSEDNEFVGEVTWYKETSIPGV